MQGLIKVLKDEERLQALFYAAQPVPPAKADAGQAAKGKDVFAKLCTLSRRAGAWQRSLPLAWRAEPGVSANLDYHYRDGTGSEQPVDGHCHGTLKNGDVVALSHYLAQLP
jgi:hypothetical protein